MLLEEIVTSVRLYHLFLVPMPSASVFIGF